jgi:hypothetical protein
MKFIDLSLACSVLDLPHPLLTNNVDIHGIVRNTVLFVIDDRPAEKYRH